MSGPLEAPAFAALNPKPPTGEADIMPVLEAQSYVDPIINVFIKQLYFNKWSHNHTIRPIFGLDVNKYSYNLIVTTLSL